ncbi:hypothetical protein PoB_002210500 [Plakobranchus ocellatus]|uniref:Uncharacterized protein n=1 Tax=Plakobranchus ocellatus TaxID=259542 RepID=A0AAV3ZIY0_9GAST|nr:hypothetical protein PoB_002210500 [Plakobranchus ocellatus]
MPATYHYAQGPSGVETLVEPRSRIGHCWTCGRGQDSSYAVYYLYSHGWRGRGQRVNDGGRNREGGGGWIDTSRVGVHGVRVFARIV